MRRKAMLDESDALFNAERRGKAEMVKNPLLNNADIDLIKNVSGFTMDEINELKKSLNI